MFIFIGNKVSTLLEKPTQIFLICVVLIFCGVIVDGTLWNLYQLRRQFDRLQGQIQVENQQIYRLQRQLKLLKNPDFIEKQARERLEYLEKNDLLFVFSED